MTKPQDNMTVDSFSQLPFIRPPSRPAPPQPRETIRLFGFNCSSQEQQPTQDQRDIHPESPGNNNNNNKSAAATTTTATTEQQQQQQRKFECHYCCRKFPTSQALGGHQNAHKLERQHAKRAHIQASLAVHRYVPGGQAYGLFNYHATRFEQPVITPTTATHLPPPPAPFPMHYPLWTGSGVAPVDQVYGGQPIAGGPLPGLWAVTPVQRPLLVDRSGGSSSTTTYNSSCSSTSPEKFGSSSALEQKDNGVSLDLRL